MLVKKAIVGLACAALVSPLALAFASCSRAGQAPKTGEASSAPSSARRYALKGTIRSIEVDARQAIIEHEAIRGYMEAMTMPFRVRDEATFNLLAPGDEITATLFVTDESSWLDGIVVVHKGASDAKAAAPAVGPKRGDAVPETALVDQDGRPVRTLDWRGTAVALTFIFTRCPLPEFCPRMGQNFAAVEKLLLADRDLHAGTQLFSISFDPAFDTPAVLKKYGKSYQPGAEAFTHWRLLTGSAAQVKTLATFFGLEYEEEKGQFTHNLRTAIVTPEGKVFRVYRGNDWKPEEVVADLRAALGLVVSPR